MNTVHTTTIVAKCPHGPFDVYEVEFHVGTRFVAIETIQVNIDACTKVPIYQEGLTQQLANRLRCRVITRGTHVGFRTVCEAFHDATGVGIDGNGRKIGVHQPGAPRTPLDTIEPQRDGIAPGDGAQVGGG